MKKLTKEWIEKAESDLRVARREICVRKDASYEAVCFHSQQCAEKYLKAYLQEHDIHFGKTHNLVELLRLCARYEKTFEAIHIYLETLNDYSVDVRYPGATATHSQARSATKYMERVRKFVRKKLAVQED